jgi:preprotein translocase subunit SecD
MKSSPLKIILSLSAVAVFLVLGAAIWLIQKYYPFKPSIERDGGTILVYELDEDNLPANYQPKDMAEAMRRRLDPTDRQNISVRPEGDTRMEIRIPRGADHEQRVEQTKELLTLAGVLEFRILANEDDDHVAIEAARRFFADCKNDPKLLEELKRRNEAGLPPSPPPAPDKNGFQTQKGSFTYSWIRMGYSYQFDFGLDNFAENEKDGHGNLTPRALQWEVAKRARKANEPFQFGLVGLGRSLIYSREVSLNRQKIGEKDKYEYFVLVRDFEDGMDNPGKYVDKASVGRNQAVYFDLTDHGGELMRDLTGRNIGRPMAIVLDGSILSAAKINDKIEKHGQITGHFTEDQRVRLVTILCGGSLPAKLKPRPVREEVVNPPKAR